jgi:hypothetical protein
MTTTADGRVLVASARWPFVLAFVATGVLYAFSGWPPNWYGFAWLLALVGLAAATDIRVTANDQGLRRSRLWGSTTIEWSDVEAVECRIKKSGTGAKAEMLTVHVWRRSRAERIDALTTPQQWSVALIGRERARRQAAELARAVEDNGVPARVRDWPGVEDAQAIPARWW